MLITFKILKMDIFDCSEYNLFWAGMLGGPVATCIVTFIGIMYLLVIIPYRILFGKDNK